jgi:hypothetical protein
VPPSAVSVLPDSVKVSAPAVPRTVTLLLPMMP